MAKNEILKQHILGMAWNLPSNVIKEIGKELVELAFERSREIYFSISAEERGRLSALYDSIIVSPFQDETPAVTVPVTFNARFVVSAEEEYDDDFPTWEPRLHCFFEDDTRVNLNDLYDRAAILNVPEVKKLWDEKIAAVQEFKVLLDTLSEKYRLDKSVIFDLMREEE
jgi:hypothetical protein